MEPSQNPKAQNPEAQNPEAQTDTAKPWILGANPTPPNPLNPKPEP